jgi:predicted nicotinamide N-methyase
MTDQWPNPVFETALAYQRTAALTAAVRLDIFSLIGSGAATVEAIALRTEASPRGARILCDYLTVIGLLQKQESSYSLMPAAGRFLDRSSPLALGECVDFLAAPEMLSLVLDDPVSYVRRGGSDGLTVVAPDHPIWIRFARAMAAFAAPGAKRVGAFVSGLPEPPRAVLDVAAGHGLYGIEVAKAVRTAVVTAVDWAGVLAIANENAQAAGVGERFRMIVGDALDVEWGSGFDLVLLPNILHYFDRDRCVALLRKVKRSVLPTGQIWAVEFVPNPDRVSPPLQAAFAFLMLETSPSGDAYTLDDLDGIARAAGFRGASARPLAPTAQTLVVFET